MICSVPESEVTAQRIQDAMSQGVSYEVFSDSSHVAGFMMYILLMCFLLLLGPTRTTQVTESASELSESLCRLLKST